MTIDVEDYFQVENFKSCIDYTEWDQWECHIVQNIWLILKLLEARDVKATFFVLGWIAERYPKLIKQIYEKGHEIASHGYAHKLIYEQTPEEFEEDLKRSLRILENIIQEPVLGYRAPSFSIIETSIWALEIIQKLGLKYDASIFPISGHDRYGMPDMLPYIHQLSNSLYEIPAATFQIFNKRWPMAGGGYFRLYPYWLTRNLIDRINNKERQPVTVYLHPWEFDKRQPRIRGAGCFKEFRHYVNIRSNLNKLSKVLDDFFFTSVRDYLRLKQR